MSSGHFLDTADGHARESAVVSTAVVCTVLFTLFTSTTARAVDPFANGPFPIGWWDSMSEIQNPALVASQGGNLLVAYETSRLYLDNAEESGIRVIMNIPWHTPDSTFTSWVNTYKDHPALVGFNIFEENWYAEGLTLPPVQARYDMIKSVTDKPVFGTFTEFAMYEASPSIPVQWKSAYDQFMIDVYPTRIGEPEFSRLEYEGRGKDFKRDMERSHQQSILADRPWWAILSGWGSDYGPSEVQGDYRLPTYAESRFATFWALNEQPHGIVHFALYRTAGGRVPARPGEPYPFDGEQWLVDVYEPQAAELKALGPALKAGKLTGVSVDDTPDVRSDVYQDPDTGKYYLVSLNSTRGNETTTFTVNVGLSGQVQAIPRFEETARPAISLTGNNFTDTFTQYEVHVYELNMLGDLNADNIVNSIDIDIHRNAVSTFSNDSIYDLNGDQVLDVQDTNYLISTILGTRIGDINLDRRIDALDMAIIRTNLGGNSDAWSDGNLFGNDIDNLDLTILRLNYGYDNTAAEPFNVPEPATLALLSLGLLWGSRRV